MMRPQTKYTHCISSAASDVYKRQITPFPFVPFSSFSFFLLFHHLQIQPSLNYFGLLTPLFPFSHIYTSYFFCPYTFFFHHTLPLCSFFLVLFFFTFPSSTNSAFSQLLPFTI
eukprot:TRINITY_DN4583_c0_g1_i1.p4 TRINITY_DN4583_c0_g1~~TRINITY_DN4583_c0_g1_i1.p4  ORF type:complete len:113 (+),score=9.08 TRINITY_DN4583_c0_g1_i1:63-401(+)